ncbi:dTDP-4-dehydrorhamnose 3,5-epimerase [Amycolatopsis antarctica]|uniref:dTDP-4-dehydrorhamnose 3,5-epimerase n=1 Tax=Amycolatopsis antarctica TaxID=1854586 RepID=A0A263D6R0_9PSEU|nr:dTDP-4-dehydrorhamnose 3,5-epimerase family protein [Amycolatopsis antarctica]OZM73718.1 dTDP-4-dehydrorhamnose 3,5-epimerase [Amycolatopsis antarctica]
MHVRELAVRDVYEFSPRLFRDTRGFFGAPFQEEVFVKTVGHPLRLGQINHSVSRLGTIRGVHFADTPPGQAKYVYCPVGALLDVVVDLRVGSPTFGTWDATRLDAEACAAVYVPEGVGHAFVALEDDTVLAYLCSTPYNPGAEHAIAPLDPELGLPWPADLEPVLSEKDRSAPALAEASAAGLLPDYAACVRHYESLRGA